MNSQPLISIVTPSYNQGNYIEDTIESILQQTYPNIEHLVIDGGSSDHTLDILRKHESPRLQWVSEKDSGQSDAIQKGFNRTRGDIVGWLNSDDVILPHTIEKVVDAFGQNRSIGIVYGDVIVTDEYLKQLTVFRSGKLTVHRLLNKNQSIPQPGSFYRKEVLDSVGGVALTLRFVMDYDLFIRVLSVSEGIYIPEPLAKFRLHAKSKSYNYSTTLSIIEAFHVSRKFGAPLFSSLNYFRCKALVKALAKQALGLPSINFARLKNTQTEGWS